MTRRSDMASIKPTIVLHSTWAREKAVRWVTSAPYGTVLTFAKAKRTLPQNARMWAMLTDIADQVIWHGQKLSPDDWKNMATAAMNGSRVVPGIEGGFVVLGARTSVMTKSEMRDLMDFIEAFGAQHGVTFHGMDDADT
jgi:hypothetical protein